MWKVIVMGLSKIVSSKIQNLKTNYLLAVYLIVYVQDHEGFGANPSWHVASNEPECQSELTQT